jgi:hypothetical protein
LVGPARLFEDCHAAPEQRLGVGMAALPLEQISEVLERYGNVRVFEP